MHNYESSCLKKQDVQNLYIIPKRVLILYPHFFITKCYRFGLRVSLSSLLYLLVARYLCLCVCTPSSECVTSIPCADHSTFTQYDLPSVLVPLNHACCVLRPTCCPQRITWSVAHMHALTLLLILGLISFTFSITFMPHLFPCSITLHALAFALWTLILV